MGIGLRDHSIGVHVLRPARQETRFNLTAAGYHTFSDIPIICWSMREWLVEQFALLSVRSADNSPLTRNLLTGLGRNFETLVDPLGQPDVDPLVQQDTEFFSFELTCSSCDAT